MPHIVLLSESIGSGHESAAGAIEEALQAACPNIRITRLNLLDTFRPLTAKLTRSLYFQTLTHSPKLWGTWYEWQREKEWNRVSRSLIHHVLKKDVAPWLRRLDPDAIVCTHPLPACLIAEMKQQGLRIPLCTVITDFDMHGYWTHPAVDLYCVPLPEMASDLEQRHPGRFHIRITGIPISEKFAKAQSETSSHPSNTTKSRVLLIGGGSGFGVLPMVESILESAPSCEINVICGHNRTLYRDLREKCGDRPGVQLHGFSRKIETWMAQSDLLVTKPGGLTISEALAMRLPMVLYTPIQGQESRNGQVLREQGVALTAHTPEEGANYVRFLLDQPSVRQEMVERMEPLRSPFAARDTAEAVLELTAIAQNQYKKTRSV